MPSTALKPYAVHTRQINRRGDGGSPKGLLYEDLPARQDDDQDDGVDE